MIAVIRIRGSVKTRSDFNYTMELLRLHRVNHLVLAEEKMLPMIKKANDFVTFGEISEKTLSELLKKRGRVSGNKRVSQEFLKKYKIKSFDELSERVLKNIALLKELGIKPVFRLNSPRKGFERQGKKKPFSVGGALGYRGEKINKLIERMM